MGHSVTVSSRALRVLVGAALWLGVSEIASATPTALNLVPTADVLSHGEMVVQLEADGHSWPCEAGGEYWLLTGLGIANRLEVGLDRSLPQAGDGAWFVDAKVQVAAETTMRPALALGALDITQGGVCSNWYLVGTKDLGDIRATIGYQSEETGRLLLGAAWSVSDRLLLISDYSSGPWGALTLGATAEVLPNAYGSLYFAWCNTTGADNFVGLNLAWYVGLW